MSKSPANVVVVEGAAVRDALLDRRLSSEWLEARTAFHEGRRPVAQDDRVGRWFLFREGPAHRELRRLVTPPFASSALSDRQEEIARDSRRLVDALPDARVDVQERLTHPLAAATVCKTTGVSTAYSSLFQGWSGAIAEYLVHDFVPETVDEGRRTLDALTEACRDAISCPRERESAAHCLAQAVAAERVSPEDAASTLALLVYAGFVTTVSLLDNVIFEAVSSGRLEGPHRLESVAALVDDVLRRFPAVPRVARRASRDLSLQGQTIREGDLVLVQLGRTAGGVDEHAEFPFGHGRHYCLGAAVARAEAESMLSELRRRFDIPRSSLSAKARPHAADEPRLFDALSLRTLRLRQ